MLQDWGASWRWAICRKQPIPWNSLVLAFISVVVGLFLPNLMAVVSDVNVSPRLQEPTLNGWKRVVNTPLKRLCSHPYTVMCGIWRLLQWSLLRWDILCQQSLIFVENISAVKHIFFHPWDRPCFSAIKYGLPLQLYGTGMALMGYLLNKMCQII